MNKPTSKTQWTASQHLDEADRLEREANDEVEESSRTAPSQIGWLHYGIVIASALVVQIAYWGVIGGFELPSFAPATSSAAPTLSLWEVRGTFGDQWGAFTALFSGLSFALLILSLMQQQREMTMTRMELAHQRAELKHARAQSHRQIAEMVERRDDAARVAKYANEPLIHVEQVSIGQESNGDPFVGATLRLRNESAWHVHVAVGVAATDPTAPSWFPGEVVGVLPEGIRSSQTRLPRGIIEKHVGGASEPLDPKKDILVWILVRYCNIAGGTFQVLQTVNVHHRIWRNMLHGGRQAPESVIPRTFHISCGDDIELAARSA